MVRAIQVVCGAALVVAAGCARQPGIQVGDTMPAFAVASTKDPGFKIDSNSYRGQPVLIDFWATWCPPCRAELPHIEEIWNKYRDRGVRVIAVTRDDLNAVNAFRAETKMQMPFYLDEDSKMSRDFGITGLPTTLVINRDGKVVYSSLGYDDGENAALDAAIEQAL